jgi:type II secretory pathway component GspD/PulD (secretin)
MSKLAACGCVLFLLVGCASPEEDAESTPLPQPPAQEQQMQVVPLQHAAAAELAAVLGPLLRRARVMADQRTNSLVIAAESEAALAEVLQLVADLDVDAGSAR